jgi:hypothetical protein
VPGQYAWNPAAFQSHRPLSPEVDGVALSDILLGALILVFGSVLSLVALQFANLGSGGAATANGGLSISTGSLDLLIALSTLGALLEALVFVKFRQGFVRLRSVDPKFGTPANLSILAIVGILILLPILIAFLEVINSTVACLNGAPPSMANQSCIDPGTFLGVTALLLVVGIILLVGYVGTLIGLYRLGDRYGVTMFKVGAVLMIIPYVNLIGAILLVLGAHSTRKRIGGARGPGRPPQHFSPF